MRIILYVFVILLVHSCQESFNDRFLEHDSQNPSKDSVVDIVSQQIEIRPFVFDPYYSNAHHGDMHYSVTSPASNKNKSVFHTFALKTRSKRVGGKADYISASYGDPDYCLLWNQKLSFLHSQTRGAFIDDNSALMKLCYKSDELPYRYKFFMLGTQGAPIQFRVQDDNKIYANIEIDGTNDIAHSFAYHTDAQFVEAISSMNPDVAKVFTDAGQDCMYNHFSGFYGVHPVFNINHLLSRFQIEIKGPRQDFDNSYDFLKVFIKDISIDVVKNVDVLVADDSWEADSYCKAFDNGQLLFPASESTSISIPIKNSVMGNTSFTQMLFPHIDFDALQAEAHSLSNDVGETVIPEESYWLGRSAVDTISPLLYIPVFPADEANLVMTIKYRYLHTRTSPETGSVHLGLYEENLYNDYIWQDLEEKLTIPLPQATLDANRDSVHTIDITVYGKSVIEAVVR